MCRGVSVMKLISVTCHCRRIGPRAPWKMVGKGMCVSGDGYGGESKEVKEGGRGI